MQKYSYYLPTYEECKAICDKYDNFQFYEGVTYVDGYKISSFNYRLIGYNDFINEKIELEEDGKKITLWGNDFINNKKISEHTDDELNTLGFEFLSKFKI